MNVYKDKIILVTGGTGSIGSSIVKRLIDSGVKQVRVFSRDDSKQCELMEELGYPNNIRLLIGDVRDRTRLDFAMEGVDIVFHAAAMKHVFLAEYNPFEVVKTNIYGSQNVVDSAIKNKVKKVIAISTDKASNPTNVLGVSKLMMEKLVINANYYSKEPRTLFSCVRFGNVAWSRGSVLSLWKSQVEGANVINVTNPEMTRFMMSKTDAARLVMEAGDIMQGGEIFVLKMPAIKIGDLANMFLKKYFDKQGVKLVTIGEKPGEKMHESLFGDNDAFESVLENDRTFICIPKINILNIDQSREEYKGFSPVSNREYISSEKYLNSEAIGELL